MNRNTSAVCAILSPQTGRLLLCAPTDAPVRTAQCTAAPRQERKWL